MKVTLVIADSKNTLYAPVVLDEISWKTERKCSPGVLSFKILKDKKSNTFAEGNHVRLEVDGKKVFYGFIFSIKRDKSENISITAYDQLRYLKGKDSMVYTGWTASRLIKYISEQFRLQIGKIEDTGYKIPRRLEDNATLFDIIYNALDETLDNKKQMYILFDQYGKLTLKSLKNMEVNFVVDETNAEDFTYTSSIDKDTYNQVKLTYSNDKTGKLDHYVVKDGKRINEWGVLQYGDKLKKGENGKAKAEALLSLYNRKAKGLSFKNVKGDFRVRAGSLIGVAIDLGDVKVKNMMLVEKCNHKISENEHFMDLSVRGADFIE
ncbi:MAG: hydrolase [Catonella sp.]